MKLKDFSSPKKHSFKYLLIHTHIYKDLCDDSCSLFSILISAILSTAIILNYSSNVVANLSKHVSDIQNLLSIILSGEFGMLGFLIGGLALTIGSITDGMLRVTDEKDNAEILLKLIFRFYFVGVFIVITILYFLSLYLFFTFFYQCSLLKIYLILLIGFYLFLNSVFGSVQLMGTNINIMILRRIWN
ncbi:hypothetical protein [Leuconostoc lactis]|uniref:hypothetical protein n=1 Tax=Leuconostoc lactis TaxID=1246 RepID=UPI0011BB8615|nr:hypothetical protein [Leuconostoc lactis]QEA51423.1 hypothetical protein FGL78_07285 [Leuconostoc lactis]